MKHLLLTTIAAVVLVGCGPDISIHKAASTGNIEAVKQHIAAGADMNAKAGGVGETPLHNAAYSFTGGRGPIRTVELLISKGANVNSKGESGGTPLDIANTWGHEPAADLLRKHGGKTGEELKAAGN